MSRASGRGLGVVLTLAWAASLGACGHPADEFPDPDLPPVAANPDGIPYPTDRIGSLAHNHVRPGDRMPNLVFRAYRDGLAGGLQAVSLAEFYDPQQKRNKVLDLQVAATWCSVCDAVLSTTVPLTDQLKAQGVVFLEVVISGETAGAGPSLDEVTEWVERHNTNFPTAIDVRGRRLAPLGVSTSVVPYDLLIDTRTMEILDSSAGPPMNLITYVDEALQYVATNPPAY